MELEDAANAEQGVGRILDSVASDVESLFQDAVADALPEELVQASQQARTAEQEEPTTLDEERARVLERAQGISPEPTIMSLGSEASEDDTQDSMVSKRPRRGADLTTTNRAPTRSIHQKSQARTDTENFHEPYPHYFIDGQDTRKTAEAAEHLDTNMIIKWRQTKKSFEQSSTWDRFCHWLRLQITDPKSLLREQNQNQSAWDFTSYLQSLEDQLAEPYSVNQRKEHLRTLILPEIRMELMKHAEDTSKMTYEAFVAKVASVENQMQGRSNAFRRGAPSKPANGDSRYPPSTGAAQGDSSQDKRRKVQNSSSGSGNPTPRSSNAWQSTLALPLNQKTRPPNTMRCSVIGVGNSKAAQSISFTASGDSDSKWSAQALDLG
ncbi:hypothetical protein ACJ73_03429 [Blastomyces percursus]|uniref:Uncharacterized protein n=1 Tax=Blastomyces percursus TaxID=1658174 RepID=A0A1J9Q8T9_9EURO|nr:hypothetical protein ACJ73_03429 [Blastomyces percursus]